MFAGEYLCKVDEKGRFIVPSPIREQIESEGQAVVFLKGPEESGTAPMRSLTSSYLLRLIA